VRDPWTPRPTPRDYLTIFRFVVLKSAMAVAVVVIIGLEDAGRAVLDRITHASTESVRR
jgi:hypothetical protein